MENLREKILATNLTQERTAFLSGVSAGRLSQICRGLTQPTEQEREKLEGVLREAKGHDIWGKIARLVGMSVSPHSGLSKGELCVCSLLASILQEIKTLKSQGAIETIPAPMGKTDE